MVHDSVCVCFCHKMSLLGIMCVQWFLICHLSDDLILISVLL